jgi:hypothetical protein
VLHPRGAAGAVTDAKGIVRGRGTHTSSPVKPRAHSWLAGQVALIKIGRAHV